MVQLYDSKFKYLSVCVFFLKTVVDSVLSGGCLISRLRNGTLPSFSTSYVKAQWSLNEHEIAPDMHEGGLYKCHPHIASRMELRLEKK